MWTERTPTYWRLYVGHRFMFQVNFNFGYGNSNAATRVRREADMKLGDYMKEEAADKALAYASRFIDDANVQIDLWRMAARLRREKMAPYVKGMPQYDEMLAVALVLDDCAAQLYAIVNKLR